MRTLQGGIEMGEAQGHVLVVFVHNARRGRDHIYVYMPIDPTTFPPTILL